MKHPVEAAGGAWARHAAAANGFGDVATCEPPPREPVSYELALAARAHRGAALRDAIVAAARAALGLGFARRTPICVVHEPEWISNT